MRESKKWQTLCGRSLWMALYDAYLWFQAARRWNIATLQNIIAYEYLPAFVGQSLPPYQAYRPELHPGISHVFQSAGFRYGHTLIPPGIMRRDAKCQFRDNSRGGILRLCSTWWEAQVLLQYMVTFNLKDGVKIKFYFRTSKWLDAQQLSNLRWMPNSVRKCVGPVMKTGSSRRFKRYPTTYMWVSSWLPFTVD